MSKHRMKFDADQVTNLPTALAAIHLVIDELRNYTETRGHRVQWSSLRVEIARHIDGDLYVTVEAGAVADPTAPHRQYVIAVTDAAGEIIARPAVDGDDPFTDLDQAQGAVYGDREVILERVATNWERVHR